MDQPIVLITKSVRAVANHELFSMEINEEKVQKLDYFNNICNNINF